MYGNYVRMYICTFVRMYVSPYARLCTYMHVPARICTYMHVYAGICRIMQVYARICTYMHVYAGICRYMHVYARICTYMHAYARMHMCMYTVYKWMYMINEFVCVFFNLSLHPPFRIQKLPWLDGVEEVLRESKCVDRASTALAKASPWVLWPNDQLHGRPSAAPAAVLPNTFVPRVAVSAKGGATEVWQENLDVHALDTPCHHFVARRQSDPAAHSCSHSKHTEPKQPWASIGASGWTTRRSCADKPRKPGSGLNESLWQCLQVSLCAWHFCLPTDHSIWIAWVHQKIGCSKVSWFEGNSGYTLSDTRHFLSCKHRPAFKLSTWPSQFSTALTFNFQVQVSYTTLSSAAAILANACQCMPMHNLWPSPINGGYHGKIILK